MALEAGAKTADFTRPAALARGARTKGRARIRSALLLLSALLFSGCDGAPSALQPKGPAAARIEGLWWAIFWIATAIFVVVVAFLVVAILRSKRIDVGIEERVPWADRFIVLAGVVLPAVILTGVFAFSLRDISALSRTADTTELTIDVIGHLWWWEARYPNGAVTANEIHIPVGEAVRLDLATDDVIHSFWVPQLQAKVDQIPGRENQMWITADEPGRYPGMCAEFCGLQHAKMLFYVVAEPPEEFEEWLALQAEPADAVSGLAALGEEIFLTTTCAGCHAVRGTPADAEVGPDLTHIDLRETLAAGIIPNTRDNMADFITDPQRIKPGVLMPPTQFTPRELAAVVAYLEELD